MTKAIGPPGDPALPALSQLFPETGAPAFVARAATELAGVPLDAARARVRYVRYRPTKSCVVLWSFPLPGGDHLLVSGRVFHDDRGAAIAGRPSFQRLANTVRDDAGMEPYRYLPAERVLLQLFPLDSRLPALPAARSQPWLRERLARLRGVDEASLEVGSADAIWYKPWRRCVMSYSVEQDGAAKRYYGKLFIDDRGARLFDSLRTIGGHLRAVDAPWRIVQPLGHVEEARLLLLEEVSGGVELKDLVKERSGGGPEPLVLETMDRIAAGLPAFQEVELDGLTDMSPVEIVRDFAHGAEDVGEVAPEFGSSVFALLRALEEQARELKPERQVLSHGAFRYDQFLLTDGGLTAIDLDTLCASGTSADAGNFLGYLDVVGVRRPELRGAVASCAARFEEAALRLPDVSPEWLPWYRAAAHVKKALRAFYSLDPRWPRMTGELTVLAERALASQAVA